jgi:diacylglycerol O-acyltransferase / wax synthase
MHKLGSTDMLMLMLDSPRTPNQMGPVMICHPDRSSGQPVTFEEIMQGVADRLPLAPMLRRRLVNPPLGLDNPYWVDDPDFDLEFHVRESVCPDRAAGRSCALRSPGSPLAASTSTVRRGSCTSYKGWTTSPASRRAPSRCT